jgi:hypothetical protein
MRAMATEPRTDSWWEPTWRRLVGSTVVLFLVILAFLVGRERAGTDPGLARETTGATTQQQVAPQGSGADPTDPFGGGSPQTDPGIDPGSGTDDGFGNALPDAGSQGFDGQDGGSPQGSDGPRTHVS